MAKNSSGAGKARSGGGWLLLLVAVAILLILLYNSRQGGVARPPAPTAEPPTAAAPQSEYLGGLPIATSPEARFQVLRNPGFLVGFNESKKLPGWVYYRLFFVPDPANLTPPSDFSRDNRTYAAVSPEDYARSGYDRGHMAPNDAISDCYGADAQRATFLMSNVVPQKPAFNRGIWKHLEALIARHYTRRASSTWVVTGPVFGASPQQLKSGVPIPDRCYKIVVNETPRGLEAIAFEMPQTATSRDELDRYLLSIRQIESHTHLNFFPTLERGAQDQLETQAAAAVWPK